MAEDANVDNWVVDLICLLSQVSLIVFVKSQLINHLGVPHLGNVAFGSLSHSTTTERNNEYGLYDRGQDWNERASAGFFISRGAQTNCS